MKEIDHIADDILSSGSKIDDLDQLKTKASKLVKKGLDLKDVLGLVEDDIQIETQKFIDSKNKYGINYISGISMCIYLPDFKNNGEYKFKLIGGNRSRDKEFKIDNNTLFDVASITKLYTLLLLFKLEELNLINLNSKISDINPDFKYLEDFTLNDLVRLCGELRTNGNIALANTKEEAYKILKTLYLKSNSKLENKYTDFGAIVIGDTIEKIISKEFNKDLKLEEIMDEFLFKSMNLKNTKYNPITNNLSGNGNDLGVVNDPKARLLGGVIGSAGIFTNSDDLAKLARELYSVKYINKEHLNRLGEVTFPNSNQSQKGNLGLYVKHPLGLLKTFTPPEFSNLSFSSQGYTGSTAYFDPNNLIHSNILVNAIYKTEDKDMINNDKPVGYIDAFDTYQREITKNIMLELFIKKYYNKYYNLKNDIDTTKYMK